MQPSTEETGSILAEAEQALAVAGIAFSTHSVAPADSCEWCHALAAPLAA